MKIIYDYFVLITNKITIVTLSIVVLVFKKYPQKIRTHYYKIKSIHVYVLYIRVYVYGQRAAGPFRSNMRLWASPWFTVITLPGLGSFISARNFVFAYFLWSVRSSFGIIYRRHFNRNRFVLIVIANWSTIETSHH